jgi:hypothetical protein
LNVQLNDVSHYRSLSGVAYSHDAKSEPVGTSPDTLLFNDGAERLKSVPAIHHYGAVQIPKPECP